MAASYRQTASTSDVRMYGECHPNVTGLEESAIGSPDAYAQRAGADQVVRNLLSMRQLRNSPRKSLISRWVGKIWCGLTLAITDETREPPIDAGPSPLPDDLETCVISRALGGGTPQHAATMPPRPMLIIEPARSRLMARVRQRGTAPELAVRALLRHEGVSYRLNACDLPGSPDIVHRGRRKAIFVHGCFWHRHPGCKRCTTPKQNFAFWQEKFDKNIQRDERKLAELRAKGYDVLVIWECETLSPESLAPKLRVFWTGSPRPKTT